MSGFRNYHFRYIKSVLYALVSIALIVFLVIYAVNNVNFNQGGSEIAEEPTPRPTENNLNKIKIQLVGDVVLNDTLISNNSNAYGEYNFDNCFSTIASNIDGDVVIFNLEGVIDANKDGTQIAGAPIYNYPKEIAMSAYKAGFNVCITANDRASYFGNEGIKNNVENLRDIGLLVSGSSLKGEKNYVIKEFNSVKVAVLAYTDKLINFDEIDTDCIASVDFYDVEGTMDRIEADVVSAKEEGAEIIIASMHWGDELASKVTDDQRELAEKMVKSGVDIIYGTRSHVFQPVTYKNIIDDSGESKNVIVAYSMGNFLSQPTITSGQKTQQSGILNIYVERDTEGKAYISSAECMPIYIYAKALDSVGTNYAYSILPATEYALSETRPEIFLNDENWENCKTAYKNMKEIVEESSANGIPLGLR